MTRKLPTLSGLTAPALRACAITARARFSAVAALAALAALGLACAEPAGETPVGTPDGEAVAERQAADRELEAVYATFTRAYRQADVALLMDSVYSDSAFYLPPGSPILHGRDQVRTQFAFLESFAQGGAGGPDIAFDITDRDVSGDLAYDIGVYTLRPPGAPEDMVGNQGKFIVIWKRDETGAWRIHADGFSPVR